ncbi:hypothetical protein BJ138DRAFT_1161074 [Hygrophoropsis aurantiaca]|uniref:Uncharacterized protein n=1 Tax=Hygrophoropsis aurantiaca TaxID=72124 RepID=A0ACB8A165_9AGAM|nr:hypothetical protein BJ138DRAFT_1161074 [Hygrophoropsis aurantiaca]
MDTPTQVSSRADSDYRPTIADIIQVKAIFGQISIPLPPELIDQILDDASYWPHSSITSRKDAFAQARYRPHTASHLLEDPVKDVMYMRTLPLAIPGVEGSFALSEMAPQEDILLGLGAVHGDEHTPANLKWLPPRGKHPVREVVFRLWSQDQGWTTDTDVENNGTYRNSHSWWDVGGEVPTFNGVPLSQSPQHTTVWPTHFTTHPSDPLFSRSQHLHNTPSIKFTSKNNDEIPFAPLPTHLQRNVRASDNMAHHTIVWNYLDSVKEGSPGAVLADLRGQGWESLDGNFIRGLEIGDCITLWMRARYHLWAVHASMATIEIYWAV